MVVEISNHPSAAKYHHLLLTLPMAKILLTLVLSLLFSARSSSPLSDGLRQGSSLSVEAPADVLVSPTGTFTAGFYPVGENAYCFAIWFSRPLCSKGSCTLVWMANRDHPVNGKQSKFSLLDSGNLILTDAGDLLVWSTGTASVLATRLNLLDTGNLVLENSKGVVLWQSFDFPTDTLLPLQELTGKTMLVSWRSPTNFSSGFRRLYFDTSNVLRIMYIDGDVSSIYWPDPKLTSIGAGRTVYNNTKIAYLDQFGSFFSTDGYRFSSLDYGSDKIQRRLKMDSDGNLRLYSREEGAEDWYVSWQAVPQQCRIHGSCGPNSICTYIPDKGRRCSCAPGFKVKNLTDWSLECEPDFDHTCNQSNMFLKLIHTEFYGYDLAYFPNYTVERCADLCLQMCACKGFQFRFQNLNMPYGTYCWVKNLLLNGQRAPNHKGDFYLRLPISSKFIISPNFDSEDLKGDCSKEMILKVDRKYLKKHKNYVQRFLLWSACAVGGIEILGVFSVWCYLIIRRKHDDDSRATGGYLLAAIGFRRFTYAEMKKATNGFKEEIGRGSGGIVYKGTLSDNRVVAIKRLIIANQDDAEFLAEVSTLDRLNHMNLIDIWGYCVEGKQEMLIFEYMEHGSLADALSLNALDWRKRFEIALGAARGLAYLHEECLEWVLHCDINPQNILLDSNYQPKVSDFGLSRLLTRGDVKVVSMSRMRGTRGYMAPEWISNVPITSKVDVYSYGIVLLEMVTGISPFMDGQFVEEGSERERTTLVKWVRKQIGEESVTKWGEKIVDPALDGQYDVDQLGLLVHAALQCVQEDKDARPTMGEVVKMFVSNGK